MSLVEKDNPFQNHLRKVAKEAARLRRRKDMRDIWEVVSDGYDREQRLVAHPSGLIIGGVSGSRYEKKDGWCAWTDGVNGQKNIGTYVTEDLAKRAVEAAQPSKGPSKNARQNAEKEAGR